MGGNNEDEPWYTLAKKKVWSRIYLSLVGKGMYGRQISRELRKDNFGVGREHFGGYEEDYPGNEAGKMGKGPLLCRDIEEREGSRPPLVFIYEANIGVYLNFLDKHTDITEPDKERVGEMLTGKFSNILNGIGAADTEGCNAILDISLSAACPDYFFKESPLSEVKDRFGEELKQGIRGFENETEAYLSPFPLKELKPKIMRLLDRLPHFPKPRVEMSESSYMDFSDKFPYFLQALVAIMQEFDDRDEDYY